MGEVINLFGSAAEIPEPPQQSPTLEPIVPTSAELDAAIGDTTRCVGCSALESCLSGLKAIEDKLNNDSTHNELVDTMPTGIRPADTQDTLLTSMNAYREAVRESLKSDVGTVTQLRSACFGLARTVRHPIKGECGLMDSHQKRLTKLPDNYRQ